MLKRKLWNCLGWAGLGILFSATVWGNDLNFRVNTQVFTENHRLLVDGKTLFHEGKAYDFLTRMQEVAVFNFEKELIYLLNLQKKNKILIPFDQVHAYVDQFYQWGKSHEKPEVREFVDPHFEIGYDKNDGKFTFVSEMFQYAVTSVKPDRPEILTEYRRFAKESCQFNLMLSPGSKTLFARSLVNDTVFKSGLLIEKLQLDITTQKGLFPKKKIFLSELRYLPRLVESDLASIRQIDEYIAIFQETTFAEYREERIQNISRSLKSKN
ncbi:MAG: hypothetical protein Q4D62_05465 [Planctomycetia bacterium]|nr:hypothetical protein [Planctomycetia bacterium]